MAVFRDFLWLFVCQQNVVKALAFLFYIRNIIYWHRVLACHSLSATFFVCQLLSNHIDRALNQWFYLFIFTR